MKIEEVQIGDRCELAPHTDLWMRGDRYGEIVTLPAEGSALVKVRLDRSGKTMKLHPSAIARAWKVKA